MDEFCHTLSGLVAHLVSVSCIWKALNSSACLGFSKGRTESQEFSGIPRPSCPSPVGPATLTERTSVKARGSIFVSEVYRSLYSPSTKCSCSQLWGKTWTCIIKSFKVYQKVGGVWNSPYKAALALTALQPAPSPPKKVPLAALTHTSCGILPLCDGKWFLYGLQCLFF